MSNDDCISKENKNIKKIGRPTVAERNKDPALAYEAMRLRLIGLSWSQIAKELGISRTTARRLCQKSKEVGQNEEQAERVDNPRVENLAENTEPEEPDYLKIDEIYEHMPKMYQRFVKLMREVRGLD